MRLSAPGEKTVLQEEPAVLGSGVRGISEDRGTLEASPVTLSGKSQGSGIFFTYLKLSAAVLLLPCPLVGIALLAGVTSFFELGLMYVALVGLECWVLWKCLRAIYRSMMAGEADAAREDERLMRELRHSPENLQ